MHRAGEFRCIFMPIQKVSNDDTFRGISDTLRQVFEIPLILWTVMLIMLEIKEQQENFI